MKLTENEIFEIMAVFEKSQFGAMHLKVGGAVLDLQKSRVGDTSNVVHLSPEFAVANEGSSGSSRTQLSTVKSPALGLLRLVPTSGEPPLVEVGAEIEKGDTVALIDVLGTMSPVIAEKSGRITALLCDADCLVEYQQDLFQLEVAG